MSGNENKPLGVGLIGCGDIAPAHAKGLAASAGARLVACMDVAEASARSLGEEWGVPWTTDAAELLSRPEVEAVTVATPAFTHADLAGQAARAGKAVVCEKPIAPDLPDADGLITACREAGVALATCFPVRYLPEACWLRGLVQAGALGEIIGVRLRSLSEKQESYWTGGYSGRTRTEWRRSRAASGGGVVITNLIHNIDLTWFITGLEVARVAAEAGTFCTPVEVEDMALACLRYRNGAIGLVDGSSCWFGGDPGWHVQILGTRGQARTMLFGRAEVFLTEPAEGLAARKWIPAPTPDRAAADQSRHAAFYDDFARAVRAGESPPITGEDGRRALEVCVAIYRAAERGRPVELPLQ